MGSSWKKLNSDKIDHPSKRRFYGGGDIFESPSPYDIPEAFRTRYCPNQKVYHIEFRYMLEEDTRSLATNFGTTLHIGKNSGRLYKIEIPVPSGNVSEVLSALEMMKHLSPDNIKRKKSNCRNEKNKRLLEAYSEDLEDSTTVAFT